MKVVIDNIIFDYDLGVKLLKVKHQDVCPYEELADIWNDIVPLTFKEILRLPNLEQRRVGINCIGLDRMFTEISPEKVNIQTIKKTTTWVNESGELVTHNFEDTYGLYKISGELFSEGLKNWQKVNDCYFVKCKDTSTDRQYLIWVDYNSICATNDISHWNDDEKKKVTATMAIAWTIQVDVAKGDIEEIIRQGDCILVKPKPDAKVGVVRHLTEEEYLNLLVAES